MSTTILLMLASAIAGSFGTALWFCPLLIARLRGRSARAGCIALFITDLAVGPEGVSSIGAEARRLRDRIDDAVRRALPDGIEMEWRDVDRFILHLPDLDLDAARDVAERLRDVAARAHVSGSGEVMRATVSAGIAVRDPDQPFGETLVRAARAVAGARRMGGDRTVTELDEIATPVNPSREQVAAAVRDGALGYDLQPIRNIRNGRIVGMEALLRWRSRGGGGGLAPGALADEIERIPDGGEDILPDLAVQAAQVVLSRPDCYLTLNITGAVLDGMDSSSSRWLLAITERLPPERLVVEVVEDTVIARPGRARELLGRLRAKGVRIALDDFGAGLSNLERLRRMPVDILKIDRAFVADLGTSGQEEIILRHLAAMTRALGIEIVAEGVETRAQVDALLSIGIERAQGYHLGRPAPVAAWLEEREALTAAS